MRNHNNQSLEINRAHERQNGGYTAAVAPPKPSSGPPQPSPSLGRNSWGPTSPSPSRPPVPDRREGYTTSKKEEEDEDPDKHPEVQLQRAPTIDFERRDHVPKMTARGKARRRESSGHRLWFWGRLSSDLEHEPRCVLADVGQRSTLE